MEILDSETGEIKVCGYFLSIAEVSFKQVGTVSLLNVHNYTLDQIWGNNSIYLFDYVSKDGNHNSQNCGTLIFL